MRAEAALGSEQEREHAARPQRFHSQRLAEKNDPRRGELVERHSAALLVLGAAAVGEVAAAQRGVHGVEDEVEAGNDALAQLYPQLRERRAKLQWIRYVARERGPGQRACAQARGRSPE